MKKHHAWIVFISLALTSLVPAAPADFSVVERGSHHRVWERSEVITRSDGAKITLPRRYVELATGMHYRENGEWRESRELIEPLAAGGAVARHGQHQAIFAENLNTLGAIELTTPDGKRLRSHVLGLAFTDTATGQSVMVATIRDSIGEIVGANQVLYRDAFTSVAGVQIDIRYRYSRAGLEQDVIIRSGGNLLRPRDFGLADATSRLQIFSEFVEAPEPQKQSATLKAGFNDERLNFGIMQIGVGVAFAVGANADAAEVPVGKTWEKREGRTFLIESLEYTEIASKLDAPRQANAAEAGAGANGVLAKPLPSALLARSFASPPVRQAKSDPMRMAKLAAPDSGFVIDYTVVTSETNSYTFVGDITYYLTSVVNMSGPLTTFEGGTVLKFSSRDGSSPRLVLKGEALFRTSAYRPVLFTAVDDNTVGQIIGNGSPSGFYADMALGLDNTDLSFNVSNIVVKYAWWGLYGLNNNQYDLINGQFLTCNQATRSQGRATYRNCLFSFCNNALLLNAAVTNIGEHLTIAQSGRVNLANADYLFLTNCLVVGTTNVGDFRRQQQPGAEQQHFFRSVSDGRLRSPLSPRRQPVSRGWRSEHQSGVARRTQPPHYLSTDSPFEPNSDGRSHAHATSWA